MHFSSGNQIQLDSHLRCPTYLNCSNIKDFVNIFTMYNTKRGGKQRSSCEIRVCSSFPEPSTSICRPLQTPADPLEFMELCLERPSPPSIPAAHNLHFSHVLQTDRFNCVNQVRTLNVPLIWRHFSFFAKNKYGTKGSVLFGFLLLLFFNLVKI